MGLFDFLKKKDSGRDNSAGPTTRLRMGEPSRLDTETERARQREIARATTAKIDAIESAMANDIFNAPEPAWGARRPLLTTAQAAAADAAADAAAAAGSETIPMSQLPHTDLLAHGHPPLAASLGEPETAAVVDEIAIMFANNELDIAQHMLQDSLADSNGDDRTVWWMLFDLYHVRGRQDAFEDLSIDYASRFETSPPTWAPLVAANEAAANRPYAGVTPTEAFGPVLDDSIAAQLQRLLELAPTRAACRLEFGRVHAVTPEGCARLVQALIALRSGPRELIVVGANELAEIVRASLVIGARDAPEAPWLLLLELLQLMDREKDFEETAMDYCVTYELSPPQFEAPVNVATAVAARAPSRSDRFMLPALIEGNATTLFDAIDGYVAQTDLAVLDGSRLGRIDYAAAAALHQRLRALTSADRVVELRDINHLVAALFRLMAYGDVARVFPHKY
ncbi:STAS domain-containing protein [Massilia sp. PWRC2]|uniref:STAS domain-containing protein n=1 Tax=Massilia sp. PWRC2 TaxID=2804626 RepID=UPI003CF5AD44